MSQAQLARQRTVGESMRARQMRQVQKVIAYVAFILVTLIFLTPILYLISSSLKTETEYNVYPIVLFPSEPQWKNYYDAIFVFPFLKYARNSMYLAVSSTILTVISSAMGGFGFARHDAKLRNALFVLVLSMLMVPRVVTTIPQFIVFSRLHLTNSYWPWILWGISGSSYHIFLFRQFFATIPRDLEDAAEVDGCSRFRIFWQIFLPNSGPVIATASIFHFRWVWGDWFTPNIFLSDDRTTLGVKLAKSYVDPQGNAIVTLTLAAIFIYILPMIIVFFLAQKYIIQGVVTSGLKG